MGEKLKRSSTDKSIQGVCGGIAEYFGISSFFVRFIFVIIPIIPVTLLVYIILANIIPEDGPPTL